MAARLPGNLFLPYRAKTKDPEFALPNPGSFSPIKTSNHCCVWSGMFSTPPVLPPDTSNAVRTQRMRSAPPSHQVAFSTKSAERVAPNIWLAEPPIEASMPPPFGFWIKIEAIKSALTMEIRTTRSVRAMIFFLKKRMRFMPVLVCYRPSFSISAANVAFFSGKTSISF